MTTPRSPRNASPRTQAKRPGDLTGTSSQRLAKERDASKLEAQKDAVAAIEDEKEVKRNTVVDYSTGPVSETATEIDLEDELVELVSLSEVKDSYTKEEFQEAVAAAVAAASAPRVAATSSLIDVDGEVEVRAKKEYIRVNFPIDDMTYGREVLDVGAQDENGAYTRAPRLGNLRKLDFEEGVKYLVDSDVADHLRSLGYLYEF